MDTTDDLDARDMLAQTVRRQVLALQGEHLRPALAHFLHDLRIRRDVLAGALYAHRAQHKQTLTERELEAVTLVEEVLHSLIYQRDLSPDVAGEAAQEARADNVTALVKLRESHLEETGAWRRALENVLLRLLGAGVSLTEDVAEDLRVGLLANNCTTQQQLASMSVYVRCRVSFQVKQHLACLSDAELRDLCDTVFAAIVRAP